MIRDIVAEFSVTVIVVLGHERLYNDMVRRFGGKFGLSVVKLARSGGVVEINDAYLQQMQNYVTKQYFYGELKNVLSPVSRTLDFKTIKVYRLAESTSLSLAFADILFRNCCDACVGLTYWSRGVCHCARD
jgi:polyribonucleotide 5'-hydroxyl-kinase